MTGFGKKVHSLWKPSYTITPKAARLLMQIEAARADVEHIPVPATVEAELRKQARMRSTHYSTRIEGNRLTLVEAEQVIQEAGTEIRERGSDSEAARACGTRSQR